MRARQTISFALLLVIPSGCGGPRTRSATTATTTSVASAEVAEPAAIAVVTCTHWDPDADPTSAPLDVAAPPESARDGGDGLRFCILRRGTGQARPTRESRVRVHYTGWTTDGHMFDSSRARGEPASFAVGGVIRGWTESLLHMTAGQVRRVWIPEALAYRGAEGMPAGMLVFDIELIGIE